MDPALRLARCGFENVVFATRLVYVGPPEKVNLESASKKGDPLEPAVRSSCCSYLRLQWHSENTPTAFVD
jgi:hypothetical protein